MGCDIPTCEGFVLAYFMLIGERKNLPAYIYASPTWKLLDWTDVAEIAIKSTTTKRRLRRLLLLLQDMVDIQDTEEEEEEMDFLEAVTGKNIALVVCV